MSGRLVDDDVKMGEVLPIELIALTESNKPLETSATIQSVYLVAQKAKKGLEVDDEERMVKPTMMVEDYTSSLGAGGVSRGDVHDLILEAKGWLPREEYLAMLREYGLPDLPPMSAAFRRHLMGLPEKERQIREALEKRLLEHRPMRGAGKKRSTMIERGVGHHYPAEDARMLRANILSNSLFPNLHNKKTLLRSM
jgi:hypothetical protein